MNWKPYTYLLRCPNDLFYYGVKYANNKRDTANPETFWKYYFTSCKKKSKSPSATLCRRLRTKYGTE